MNVDAIIGAHKLHKEERRQAWKTAVAGYYETIKKSNAMSTPSGTPTAEYPPQLVCTWCCKDTKTDPCEHCGNSHTISDKGKPHRPEWSRKTISEVACKICGRSGPYSIQGDPAYQVCPGTAPVDLEAKTVVGSIQDLSAQAALSEKHNGPSAAYALYKDVSNRLSRIRRFSHSIQGTWPLGHVDVKTMAAALEDMCLGWEPGTRRTEKLKSVYDTTIF